MWYIVTSSTFEGIIMAVIVLNMVQMAINFED